MAKKEICFIKEIKKYSDLMMIKPVTQKEACKPSQNFILL